MEFFGNFREISNTFGNFSKKFKFLKSLLFLGFILPNSVNDKGSTLPTFKNGTPFYNLLIFQLNSIFVHTTRVSGIFFCNWHGLV